MIDVQDLRRLGEREGGHQLNRRDRRYDISTIAWPQSVCPGCAAIGASGSFRRCRCSAEMITIESLEQYRALLGALPQTKPALPRPRRKETVAQRRTRRRTKFVRA